MRRTGILLSGILAGAIALTGLSYSHAMSPEKGVHSGVDKGDMLSAFEPYHVSGADKDTVTCPVCKYPSNPAVQVWVNADDAKNVAAIVDDLEKETRANADKKMKAFVIFINPDKQPKDAITKRLKELAAKEKVQNVALAFLPGPDNEAVQDYKINTDAQVKNTVFVYRNRKVDAKFVNFVADKQGLTDLNAAVKHVLQ
jgi:hypothetical protein